MVSREINYIVSNLSWIHTQFNGKSKFYTAKTEKRTLTWKIQFLGKKNDLYACKLKISRVLNHSMVSTFPKNSEFTSLYQLIDQEIIDTLLQIETDLPYENWVREVELLGVYLPVTLVGQRGRYRSCFKMTSILALQYGKWYLLQNESRIGY